LRLDKALLVFWKDFIEISRNKEVLLPMIIVPLIFSFFLPAISVIIPDQVNSSDSSSQFERLIENLPEDVRIMIGELDSLQQSIYIILVYFFAPFFLIIPVMASSVISSDSFAGEKERNTLEALLAMPLTDSELLFGKILVGFVPSVIITFVSFIIYTVTVDLLTFRRFGVYILPTLPWLVMIIVLAPAIALLGIGVTVVISSKVKGFREAQQLSAMLVVPVLALVFGQASGYLILGGSVIIVLSIIIGIIDFLVFRFGLFLFQREKILSQSK